MNLSFVKSCFGQVCELVSCELEKFVMSSHAVNLRTWNVMLHLIIYVSIVNLEFLIICAAIVLLAPKFY